MENKRSREDLVANILEITSSAVNQTTIMFKANLSYSQLKYYMTLLQKQRLMEQKTGKWVTTMRGREYLLAYSELQKIVTGKNASAPNQLIENKPVAA